MNNSHVLNGLEALESIALTQADLTELPTVDAGHEACNDCCCDVGCDTYK